ncbi:MAG TPA: hypothetical protein VE309_04750 [Caulobacteraceae bacterium]|nr:hypothetical protein [Caulobacteraceae bacterium]
MSEDRKRILDLLAAGKINVDEAERLIAALGGDRSGAAADAAPARKSPKYLRVVVNSGGDFGHGPAKVNIRIPMQLLRAGVRLGALIPAQAREEVNRALREQGIPLDVSQIKPDNLESLIEQLGDFNVDVDDGQASVRVFCE